MPDVKEVIKGLECCAIDGGCGACPYDSLKDCPGSHPTPETLMKDALALLKAQEPEALDMPKPDSEIGCWYDITHNYTLEQVVSALKAQEPRVMTLGDLRDIGSVWELNTPPYLWMEINPSYRWTRGFWVAWREIYDMIDGLHPTYDADNYGKIWRCRTSRPTDEQREATPWE